MQVKKQQLEPVMKKWTGSKLGELPILPFLGEEKDWIGPCPVTGENVAQEEIFTSDFSAHGP